MKLLHTFTLLVLFASALFANAVVHEKINGTTLKRVEETNITKDELLAIKERHENLIEEENQRYSKVIEIESEKHIKVVASFQVEIDKVDALLAQLE